MKFLCDEMLARLGRWLRAAGYDTEIITRSLSDSAVYLLALQERRLLISRDRHFLEIDPRQEHVLWLKANELKECIQEINAKLPLNWLHHPFSRCLICNQMLVKADEQARKSVPKDIGEREKDSLLYCMHCQKTYWEGSHTRRMRETLTKWQNQREKSKD
ncbi:DUF5615 family PIN-like protein [Candidatus Protochlamydia phocaeensis]|uniref:DUF5615 family PIN-like protein n=1 Tax=Candidatus Protochlamydia phocaeensis TaxID=1414722 RepID=UPI000838A669|nr:DUF5615 family PIN-like protein [Candidatus Protochlamydia phocaeensis]